MFELIVNLSRYLFVFLIFYFIVLGLLYIADERDIMGYNARAAVYHQRFVIIATHILAFVILSYDMYNGYDIEKIILGAAFLLVFIYSCLAVKVFYKDSCPLILNGVFYLLNIGYITLTRLSPSLARRQLVWMFTGVTLAMLVPLVFKVFKDLDKLKYVYLALSWIFVLLPFFFGVSILGSTRWVDIYGITFQPTEAAKFFYIFYLASVFYRKPLFREMILPTVMAGGIVLTLVLHNDLGDALILFMTYLVIVYISTSNPLYFLAGTAFACVSSVLAHSRLTHIQRRVLAWANPWADINDAGYQIAQSLFALGTWGLFGSGLTRGLPDRIPVATTDMIFAAISEEFGALFAVMLIGVLLMVLFRGVITSLRSENLFYCILAASITGMMAFQSFLILGGTIKLIPLTGVTLPFVSYGGSSLVISIIMAGILAELSKITKINFRLNEAQQD